MFKDLFINATILVSALFITGQRFAERPLTNRSSTKEKFFIGAAAGVVGSILVIYSMRVTNTVVVDFRYIVLMVAALHGGIVSCFLAGIIIAVFRLFFFGISKAAVAGAIFLITAAAGCSIINVLITGRKKKWLFMTCFCILNTLAVLTVLLKNFSLLLRTFTIFSACFLILSFLVYHYSQRIALSNKLIRMLKEESTKDFLTGLNNVRSFDDFYNKTFTNAVNNNQAFSLLIIDIDHFKKVNDTYGHPSGDEILRQLADILVKCCRSNDFVSRNGGEEFTVLLPNCPSEKALLIAERLRKEVENHQFSMPTGKQLKITVSIGLASYPNMQGDHENLYKNADTALYEAKNHGRNMVCAYHIDGGIHCELTER